MQTHCRISLKKNFKTTTDNVQAIQNADAIFICVLPQQLDGALVQIRPAIDLKKQLVVSVVTGVHTQVFRTALGDKLRIIRAMPNTAMKVGESMTCIAAVNATQKDITLVQNLFDTMGQSILINEELKFFSEISCNAFALRLVMVISDGLHTFDFTNPSAKAIPIFPPPIMAAFIIVVF